MNKIEKMTKRFVLTVCMVIMAAGMLSVSWSSDYAVLAKANSVKYTVKTTKNLNVRSKSTSSSKKLGVVSKGKTVTATKVVKSKWYRIKYKKKTAYIYKPYTTLKKTRVIYGSAKKGKTTESLNVRASHSANSKKLGTIAKGKTVTLTGHYVLKDKTKWYTIKYKGKVRCISAPYVKLIAVKKTTNAKPASTTTQNANFEAYMTSQGFPASYKPYLRKLHKAHPKWVFVAKKAGFSWDALNRKARKLGANCIDSNVSTKWRSKASSVYDSKKKKWIKTFDGGRWYQASDAVISYYLDPRNFLDDEGIYQFMEHNFHSASQTKNTIKSIVSTNPKCFMNNSTYLNYIYDAGKAAKVNPNVIAAMIIMEQGWEGKSSLISGHNLRFLGYYNFFNIGAYTANGMSAAERGLWYAKGEGINAKTYGRPWDTKYKAIKGGAMFYHQNYVSKKQDTYYTKKFNVMNGINGVAGHEYMTNVMGAYDEGRILRYAYRQNTNFPIRLFIPVYNSMPAKASPKPAT